MQFWRCPSSSETGSLCACARAPQETVGRGSFTFGVSLGTNSHRNYLGGGMSEAPKARDCTWKAHTPSSSWGQPVAWGSLSGEHWPTGPPGSRNWR